ncbi:MAG: hypothetical protein Q4G68_12520 [Planctomycetia bacterium]|nr:hypothetical protein [Planctomycetia bacterium]
MTSLLVTVALAAVMFALFGLSLVLGRLFGRKERKCACAQARAIMRQRENRRRERRKALAYNRETIDVKNLPIVSPED